MIGQGHDFIPWKEMNITWSLAYWLGCINCYCGKVDQRKTNSLINSRDHCQRPLPLRISLTLRAGFEPVQNLISGIFI